MPRPFWEMLHILRAFEGTRCLWRLPVAGLAFTGPVAIPSAFAVATVYIGADLEPVHVLLAAFVGVAGTYATTWWQRKQLWRTIVARRLWTYEKPNPAAAVPVLVAEADLDAAIRVLRSDRFNPTEIARVGTPPTDAPTLDTRISVHEPEAWTRSQSESDRITLVYDLLVNASIHARVASMDTP